MTTRNSELDSISTQLLPSPAPPSPGAHSTCQVQQSLFQPGDCSKQPASFKYSSDVVPPPPLPPKPPLEITLVSNPLSTHCPVQTGPEPATAPTDPLGSPSPAPRPLPLQLLPAPPHTHSLPFPSQNLTLTVSCFWSHSAWSPSPILCHHAPRLTHSYIF